MKQDHALHKRGSKSLKEKGIMSTIYHVQGLGSRGIVQGAPSSQLKWRDTPDFNGAAFGDVGGACRLEIIETS
jgi:hypothetical protein